MSRIGNLPILIPEGVTVIKTGAFLEVKGQKGILSLPIDRLIDLQIEDGKITVIRNKDDKNSKAVHGLVRSLISNMVVGVSQGWTRNLELVGVGFKALLSGSKLILSVGFSHPVEVEVPQGIQFEVTDNTKIRVIGIDKNLVGQVAANIKKIKPPDVYKGKGIRFTGEYIRKKPGKSGKVGAK